MSFETFCGNSEVWKNRGLFQLGPVIESIRSSLKLEDRPFFLFLHVDEFQAIFEFERRLSPQPELFKAMQNDLGTHMTGQADRKTFMQTFFSGTELRSVTSQKRASLYSWKFFDCPLLPLLDCVEIMRQFATEQGVDDKNWIAESWIHRLLSDTGGLPRALQLLFIEFFGNTYSKMQGFFEGIEANRDNANGYFIRVASQLDEKYGIKAFVEQHRRLALELTYRSLGSVPTSRRDILSTDDPQLNLDELESNHHVILESIEGDQVLIQIPFLFLSLYNEVLQVARRDLFEAFYPTSKLEWQGWERFLAEFEAFRTNLLVHMGRQSLPLGEIYRGGYGCAETLDRPVKLSKLTVVQIGQQFPKNLNIFDTRTGQSIKWEENFVVINGTSAPFGDCFLRRERAGPDNDDLIVCLQAKLKKAQFDRADILAEHNKNRNCKNASDLLKKYKLITVVISNQRWKEGEDITIPPKDTILICWRNFVKYFGEIFASRADLELATQRNPNFGEPERLMRSGQMDADTAAEIKRKRPFESLTDMCEKVEYVKSHLEYFGFEDLGDFSFYPYDETSPTKKARF